MTQIEKLRQFWNLGDFKSCLKLASGWQRLGNHKVAIQRACASMHSPRIYEEMGYDPTALFEEGKAALATRYNLPTHQSSK